MPPPAYTPTVPATDYSSLSTFRSILIVDSSGFTAGRSWEAISSALGAATPICASKDNDGISLYFLNQRFNALPAQHRTNAGSCSAVCQTAGDIFQRVLPCSTHPPSACLQSILTPYKNSLTRSKHLGEEKPLDVIAITDGQPSHDPESIIMQQTKQLECFKMPLYSSIRFY